MRSVLKTLTFQMIFRIQRLIRIKIYRILYRKIENLKCIHQTRLCTKKSLFRLAFLNFTKQKKFVVSTITKRNQKSENQIFSEKYICLIIFKIFQFFSFISWMFLNNFNMWMRIFCFAWKFVFLFEMTALQCN